MHVELSLALGGLPMLPDRAAVGPVVLVPSKTTGTIQRGFDRHIDAYVRVAARNGAAGARVALPLFSRAVSLLAVVWGPPLKPTTTPQTVADIPELPEATYQGKVVPEWIGPAFGVIDDVPRLGPIHRRFTAAATMELSYPELEFESYMSCLDALGSIIDPALAGRGTARAGADRCGTRLSTSRKCTMRAMRDIRVMDLPAHVHRLADSADQMTARRRRVPSSARTNIASP